MEFAPEHQKKKKSSFGLSTFTSPVTKAGKGIAGGVNKVGSKAKNGVKSAGSNVPGMKKKKTAKKGGNIVGKKGGKKVGKKGGKKGGKKH